MQKIFLGEIEMANTNSNNLVPSNEPHSKAVDLRNLTKDELKQVKNRQCPNLFKKLKINDTSILDGVSGRSQCKKCGKSRKYFCYTCYIPVPELENEVPHVQLPCHIDIIKHPREIDGKSTAIHAAIIAPENVRIFTYPDIPNYRNEKNVFLIFPDKDAVQLEDLWTTVMSPNFKNGDLESQLNKVENSNASFCRAVFIDSTWNQTKKIRNDERLNDLICVELSSRETLFWRYQTGKPKTHLATIEAIYYFVLDIHEKKLNKSYSNEYDNLLFFFKYMYEKIHLLYDSNNLLAYKDI